MDGCESPSSTFPRTRLVGAEPQDWVAACAGQCQYDFVPFHFYGTNANELIKYAQVSSIIPHLHQHGYRLILGLLRGIQKAPLDH